MPRPHRLGVHLRMSDKRLGRWTRIANLLSITPRELNWAAVVALLVMLLTSVPAVWGWIATPKGMVYMGYVFGVADHAVHSAWMREAQLGMVLFDDPFTTDPQRPHFFHVYYLLLGTMARLLHLPLMLVEQSSRLLCGWALLVVVYAFSAQFTRSVLARRSAVLFTGLSSGVGWIVNTAMVVGHPTSRLGFWSMDYAPPHVGLVMPEAITFLSLMGYDLFALSYLLLTTTFYLLWLAWRRRSWPLAAWAGVSAMFLTNAHSYDAVTVWAVGGMAVVALGIAERRWPGREIGMLGLVAAQTALPLAYQYYIFQTSSVFHDKASTVTWSLPFRAGFPRPLTGYLTGTLRYLLTFGLCAVAGSLAVVRGVQRRDPGWLYLSTWALVPFVLVYLPFPFQRKLAEGMHLPIAILAALGIAEVVLGERRGRDVKLPGRRPVSPRLGSTVVAAFLVLTVPSNLRMARVVTRELLEDAAGSRAADLPPYYLQSGEVQAMKWLADHTSRDDAVLCMNMAGVYIPRVAGNHTFLSHWAESINFAAKRVEVLRFLGAGDMEPMTDGERIALARAHGIKYLYFGRYEKMIASIDPDSMALLELVYANPTVRIYRIRA